MLRTLVPKTAQRVEKPLRALFCPSSRGLSTLFCGVWSLFVWCFKLIWTTASPTTTFSTGWAVFDTSHKRVLG